MNTSSNSTIIARSPGTDVLVLLISRTQGLALKELFHTGVGNNSCLINIKQIARELEEGLCQKLPVLHSSTRCDTTIKRNCLISWDIVFFGVIFSRIYIFADLPPKVTIDFSISLQYIKAYSFEVKSEALLLIFWMICTKILLYFRRTKWRWALQWHMCRKSKVLQDSTLPKLCSSFVLVNYNNAGPVYIAILPPQ